MNKATFLLLAALPGACCTLRAAQTEAADSLQVHNLKEVEVLATRADSRTPVAYTNVTAAELKRASDGRDLPYLLEMTPSVIVTSDAGAGTGYTSIRVRGTDASRINVTANGVPVNDAESHNVYWVNIPDIAASLRDVQIQRGAGTSTNGAGAFGASINMMTGTPSPVPYAEAAASYGMYNTNRQSVSAGTGLMGGHWTVDARISHIGTDGYIDRASAKLWSYFGQLGFYSGATSLRFVSFGGSERTYMAWDYASLDDIEKYGRRYNPCGEYTDSQGNVAYYPNQYDNYALHNFQLLLNSRLGRLYTLNLALHYTKGDGYYEQLKTHRSLIEYGLTPYLLPDGTEVKKSDLVRLKKMDNGFGGAVFSLKRTDDHVTSVLGGGINNYKGHHFGQVSWVRNYLGAIDPLQEYYRNLGEKLDMNLYLRANARLWRGLSAYADLQYRHIDYSITGVSDTYDWNIGAMQRLDIKRHFNFFNPKAGLNYEMGTQRVYASFAVAHREPTRDNFIDCAPDRLPVAERLDDWEIGYEGKFSMLSVGANLYYMDYRNQLVPTGQVSDTGNSVQVNVPRSYRMGVELMLGLKPAKWFDWQFTTTLSRNRVKDFVEYLYDDEWALPAVTFNLGNTPIAFSPDVTLHNSLNFNWHGMDASLASQLVGKQYLTNTGREEDALKSYFVTDLHLGYTFHSLAGLKELRLGFSVYNLFDAKYFSNGYAGGGYYLNEAGEREYYRYAGYAAQAPVHLMGSVSVKF